MIFIILRESFVKKLFVTICLLLALATAVSFYYKRNASAVCAKSESAEEEFDRLMGKKTSHWQHVTQLEDCQALERYKALYVKNKLPLEGAAKIPHVVHFIWLGPRPFPPESVENIRSWIAQNPDWTFKFWTDRDRPPPCNGMEKKRVQDFSFHYLGDCFAQSQNYGEQSDVLRYEILFQEGGVYADHDANCLQPFESLHSSYDLYCGLEPPHVPFAGHNVTAGNGVIASRSNHPVIEKVLQIIAQHWSALGEEFRGKDPSTQGELVLNRTYIALTKALKECVDRDGNRDIVFPAAHFFAKSGLTPLYSKHFFANSWAGGNAAASTFEICLQKTIGKVDHRTKQIEQISLVLFLGNALVLVLMGGYLIYRRVK